MNSRFGSAANRDVSLVRGTAAALIGAMMLAIGLAAPLAHAQSIELPRAHVVEQLGARYAEAQAAVGVTADGGVIEVFTTDSGSTWTLVLTRPDGTSRIIAAGESWINR